MTHKNTRACSAEETPLVLTADDDKTLVKPRVDAERRDYLVASVVATYETGDAARVRRREFVGPRLNWLSIYKNRPEPEHRKARRLVLAAEAAIRRRFKDAERQRAKRADPAVIAAKLLSALLRATAKAPGNRFLEKIVGRESSFVMCRQAMTEARAAHGPKCSDRKIAAVYTENTGEVMNKRQAQNRRNVIARLEAPGGAWHRLK